MPRRPARKFSAAGPRPRARQRRYWVGAALGALALASPLAIAAAPAAAQGIQFGSVSGDGSGDLGITVTSDYPLTDWTISLSSGTSSYTLDDFSDFTDESAPFNAGTPQTYVLNASAAKQDLESTLALPPGNYTATATAATAGTGSNVETLASSQALTGTFAFLAQPTLALSGPSFYTTQPSQAVTIKGQITGCSTLACPASWSNTSVTVTDVKASGQPYWTGATTDSSGDFSVPGVTGVPGDSYSASVPAVQGKSLVATAPSDTVDVPQYAQTSITTVKANPAPYGKQSITGQLTYQPPSGGFNQDAPAGISITAASGSHKVSTTTGPNGDFKLTLPGIPGTTTWLLSTQNDLAPPATTPATPFLAGTQYSVAANQLWPVKINFRASLDKYGYVTVRGCMSATIKQRPPADSPTMYIYWRSQRSGRWRELGYLSTMRHEDCAGFWFYGSHVAPAASAYYRAYFQGDNVYARAISANSGRLWNYPTRFRPFRPSSRSVAAGHKVTISGTLQYQAGSKWRGYGNQRIALIFSKNGKNHWYAPPDEAIRTNSKGAFSWTFSDTYHSEYWQAIYKGNARHRYAASHLIRIKVHGHASANLTAPVSPPAGLRPVSRLSDPSLGLGGWVMAGPYAMSPDPWLALMG